MNLTATLIGELIAFTGYDWCWYRNGIVVRTLILFFEQLTILRRSGRELNSHSYR